LDSRDEGWAQSKFIISKDLQMTYLEVDFIYRAAPGEAELRAIDSVREVYGIRRIVFDEKKNSVRVEYDASRLSQPAVARLLRDAGIDIPEPMLA
jgi:hypothetical protein